MWEALYHSERWPAWWAGLLRVQELARGDACRIGSVRRFTWKGWLPYTLHVDMRLTRVDPPTLLESVATGELDGIGSWRLAAAAGGTEVNYDWRVRTTQPWMNVITPLARGLFAWNHDLVMRRGERGLKRLLER